jgi:hypothetical protein
MIALIITVFAGWAVCLLVAYLLDDQARGRRIGGTR